MRRSSVSHVMQSRLEHRAADMRNAPTTTEALLWAQLSGSKLGVGFRRQAVIGRYIVDFVAPSVKLVVEVDGGYHTARGKADARRDRVLGELGYRVVRVDAAAVLRNVGEAVAVVRAALG